MRSFPCNQCGKQFRDKGKVKYSCNQCEYKAAGKESLKAHIDSVHKKVKHACNLCGKEFTLKRNLKTHKNQPIRK